MDTFARGMMRQRESSRLSPKSSLSSLRSSISRASWRKCGTFTARSFKKKLPESLEIHFKHAEFQYSDYFEFHLRNLGTASFIIQTTFHRASFFFRLLCLCGCPLQSRRVSIFRLPPSFFSGHPEEFFSDHPEESFPDHSAFVVLLPNFFKFHCSDYLDFFHIPWVSSPISLAFSDAHCTARIQKKTATLGKWSEKKTAVFTISGRAQFHYSDYSQPHPKISGSGEFHYSDHFPHGEFLFPTTEAMFFLQFSISVSASFNIQTPWSFYFRPLIQDPEFFFETSHCTEQPVAGYRTSANQAGIGGGGGNVCTRSGSIPGHPV